MNNTPASFVTSNRKTVRIGVFIPYGAQLLDVACIDIFGSMGREYFEVLDESFVPRAIYDLAPSVEIFCKLSFSLRSNGCGSFQVHLIRANKYVPRHEMKGAKFRF